MIEHGHKIAKTFQFNDFLEAKYFLDLAAIIAQQEDHHPLIKLDYNKLYIELTTHVNNGLTENDFIMARLIDEIEGIYYE